MEWKKLKISDVAFINPESVDKKYPYTVIDYIDISSVGVGSIDLILKIALSNAPSRARRIVKQNDTILSTVRPNRRSFYFFKKTSLNMVVSTGFAVLRSKGNIDPRFLYYLISDQKITDHFALHAKGSAYPAIDTEIISNTSIFVPSLQSQQRIVSILSTYDDLIENNTRRIKILEEMAKLIYREWFVEFKAPGVKLRKATAEEKKVMGKDQFPKGWEVKSFFEEVFYQEGPGLRTTMWTNIGMKVINVKNIIGNGELNVTNTDKYISNELFEKAYKHFEIKEGDFVIASSGNTYGKTGRILDYHLPLLLNTSVIRFKTYNNKQLPNSYLWYFLNSQEFKNQIENFVIGSAIPNFGPTHLKRFTIIKPSEEMAVRCDKLFSSILLMVDNLRKKNRVLRMSRDLLLPKLVSGEIEV